MFSPPAAHRPLYDQLARSALSAAGMDCVGLYRFTAEGQFDNGVILGMPEAFVRRYETLGIAIDPVLAELRRSMAPASTETMLGERWPACHLFRQVSGEFGLKGFAALPLFEMDRLAGIIYLGALSETNQRRLGFDGICQMTAHAARLTGALLNLPRQASVLTSRQDQVARLAAAGLANREIAETLGTGEASVRKHLKALNLIYRTRNRTAMAARWRLESRLD